jgi:2'-5' RNA ligase
MGPRIRSFLAIELAPAARDAAVAAADALRARPGGERVRWVRPENLHVTLHFLGSIHPDRVSVLADQVGREAAAREPFTLHLGALRGFPPRRPRVASLEVGPEAELVELAAAVSRGAVASGLPGAERPFRPHLTLGRLRDGRFPDASDLPDADADSAVTEVVLFESTLGRGGSSYTPLERIPLGGAITPNPA